MRTGHAFGDFRQSVNRIESNRRSVSSSEPVAATRILECTLSDLTEPFGLNAIESFAWRQTDMQHVDLATFEAKAGAWVAAYGRMKAARRTKQGSSQRKNRLDRQLGITIGASFDDAAVRGEEL